MFLSNFREAMLFNRLRIEYRRTLESKNFFETTYTGCPIDIVQSGIRIFDIKGPSKNINSSHLARSPWSFLGLGANFFQKDCKLCDFLTSAVRTLKFVIVTDML
jgi:hypothetical protein